ncbi:MAG: DUF58 domain-containing protein [Candidatus Omnitrophica bacterium]|nr:DUF58 domain-containing protein [Candidatus Omnitrophota bacterium]
MKCCNDKIFKIISTIVCLFFIINTLVPPSYAQSALPSSPALITLTPAYEPLLFQGLQTHPENPFRFDFIITKGNSAKNSAENIQDETNKIIHYFLASLTIQEKDLWVNLSPYEADRIIPLSLSTTEMGKAMLEQDYLLKKISASLTLPEGEIGQSFWDEVYKKIYAKYKRTDLPTNMFLKIWVVPQKAVVYENAKGAFIVESSLKVMLEQDYAAWQHSRSGELVEPHDYKAQSHALIKTTDETKTSSDIQEKAIKEIILPAIEKEINHGKHFAPLRQIYRALILAGWYKRRLKESFLNKAYSDQNKTSGIDLIKPKDTNDVYQQYLSVFKQGVYQYIKEEYDPIQQTIIPRKYFSGGLKFSLGGPAAQEAEITFTQTPPSTKGLDDAMLATVDLTPANKASLATVQLMAKEFDAFEKNYLALWRDLKEDGHGLTIKKANNLLYHAADEKIEILKSIESYKKRVEPNSPVYKALDAYAAEINEIHNQFKLVILTFGVFRWAHSQRGSKAYKKYQAAWSAQLELIKNNLTGQNSLSINAQERNIILNHLASVSLRITKKEWESQAVLRERAQEMQDHLQSAMARVKQNFSSNLDGKPAQKLYSIMGNLIEVLGALKKDSWRNYINDLIGHAGSQAWKLSLRNRFKTLLFSQILMDQYPNSANDIPEEFLYFKNHFFDSENIRINQDEVDRLKLEADVLSSLDGYTPVKENDLQKLQEALLSHAKVSASLIQDQKIILKQKVKQNLPLINQYSKLATLIGLVAGLTGHNPNQIKPRAEDTNRPAAAQADVQKRAAEQKLKTEQAREALLKQMSKDNDSLKVASAEFERIHKKVEVENGSEKLQELNNELTSATQKINEQAEQAKTEQDNVAKQFSRLVEQAAALKSSEEHLEKKQNLASNFTPVKNTPATAQEMNQQTSSTKSSKPDNEPLPSNLTGTQTVSNSLKPSPGGGNPKINNKPFAQIQGGNGYWSIGRLTRFNPETGEFLDTPQNYKLWPVEKLNGLFKEWIILPTADRTSSPRVQDQEKWYTMDLMIPDGYVIDGIEANLNMGGYRIYVDRENGQWKLLFKKMPGMVKVSVRPGQEDEISAPQKLTPVDSKGQPISYEQVSQIMQPYFPAKIWEMIQMMRNRPEAEKQQFLKDIGGLFVYTVNPLLKSQEYWIKNLTTHWAGKCSDLSPLQATLSYLLDLPAEVVNGYLINSSNQAFAANLHTWAKNSKGILDATTYVAEQTRLYKKDGVTTEMWQAEMQWLDSRGALVNKQIDLLYLKLKKTILGIQAAEEVVVNGNQIKLKTAKATAEPFRAKYKEIENEINSLDEQIKQMDGDIANLLNDITDRIEKNIESQEPSNVPEEISLTTHFWLGRLEIIEQYGKNLDPQQRLLLEQKIINLKKKYFSKFINNTRELGLVSSTFTGQVISNDEQHDSAWAYDNIQNTITDTLTGHQIKLPAWINKTYDLENFYLLSEGRMILVLNKNMLADITKEDFLKYAANHLTLYQAIKAKNRDWMDKNLLIDITEEDFLKYPSRESFLQAIRENHKGSFNQLIAREIPPAQDYYPQSRMKILITANQKNYVLFSVQGYFIKSSLPFPISITPEENIQNSYLASDGSFLLCDVVAHNQRYLKIMEINQAGQYTSRNIKSETQNNIPVFINGDGTKWMAKIDHNNKFSFVGSWTAGDRRLNDEHKDIGKPIFSPDKNSFLVPYQDTNGEWGIGGDWTIGNEWKMKQQAVFEGANHVGLKVDPDGNLIVIILKAPPDTYYFYGGIFGNITSGGHIERENLLSSSLVASGREFSPCIYSGVPLSSIPQKYAWQKHFENISNWTIYNNQGHLKNEALYFYNPATDIISGFNRNGKQVLRGPLAEQCGLAQKEWDEVHNIFMQTNGKFLAVVEKDQKIYFEGFLADTLGLRGLSFRSCDSISFVTGEAIANSYSINDAKLNTYSKSILISQQPFIINSSPAQNSNNQDHIQIIQNRQGQISFKIFPEEQSALGKTSNTIIQNAREPLAVYLPDPSPILPDRFDLLWKNLERELILSRGWTKPDSEKSALSLLLTQLLFTMPQNKNLQAGIKNNAQIERIIKENLPAFINYGLSTHFGTIDSSPNIEKTILSKFVDTATAYSLWDPLMDVLEEIDRRLQNKSIKWESNESWDTIMNQLHSVETTMLNEIRSQSGIPIQSFQGQKNAAVVKFNQFLFSYAPLETQEQVGKDYRAFVRFTKFYNQHSSMPLDDLATDLTPALKYLHERIGNQYPFDTEVAENSSEDALRGTLNFFFKNAPTWSKLGFSTSYHEQYRQWLEINGTINQLFTNKNGQSTSTSNSYSDEHGSWLTTKAYMENLLRDPMFVLFLIWFVNLGVQGFTRSLERRDKTLSINYTKAKNQIDKILEKLHDNFADEETIQLIESTKTLLPKSINWYSERTNLTLLLPLIHLFKNEKDNWINRRTFIAELVAYVKQYSDEILSETQTNNDFTDFYAGLKNIIEKNQIKLKNPRFLDENRQSANTILEPDKLHTLLIKNLNKFLHEPVRTVEMQRDGRYGQDNIFKTELGRYFETVREYNPGYDDPRFIDWNISARTGDGKTYVRLGRKEVISSSALAIDFRHLDQIDWDQFSSQLLDTLKVYFRTMRNGIDKNVDLTIAGMLFLMPDGSVTPLKITANAKRGYFNLANRVIATVFENYKKAYTQFQPPTEQNLNWKLKFFNPWESVEWYRSAAPILAEMGLTEKNGTDIARQSTKIKAFERLLNITNVFYLGGTPRGDFIAAIGTKTRVAHVDDNKFIVDQAMITAAQTTPQKTDNFTRGGIDLRSENMPLTVKTDKNFQLPTTQTTLLPSDIPGLVSVIVSQVDLTSAEVQHLINP